MRIYKSFARSAAVELAGYITEACDYGKNRARDIALYKIHCANPQLILGFALPQLNAVERLSLLLHRVLALISRTYKYMAV